LAAVAVAAAAGAIATGAAPAASPPSGAIVFGLVVVAIQSISEEAFFRGWLQPILCADWGVRVGLLVTSAMFGGLHIIAGAHGPLAVVNLFLGGLLFGLLALRTGSLVVPAAAHFAWNWTESGVLGLAEDPSGSLINLKLTGQPLWNGGADTMNGSLATSLVLTALVVAAFLWKSAPRAV
jgi:membrane protease YdiL (CAAX protease family)